MSLINKNTIQKMNSSIEEFMMTRAIQCSDFDMVSHIYNLIKLKADENVTQEHLEKEKEEDIPLSDFEYRPCLYDETGKPVYERPFSTQQVRGDVCPLPDFENVQKMKIWMKRKALKEWHEECARQNDIKLAEEAVKKCAEWRDHFQK